MNKKVGKGYMVAMANMYISKPKFQKIIHHANGNTGDIIEVLMLNAKDSYLETAAFAKHIKGPTLEDTLRNLWTFVKRNLIYKVDPSGEQWIQRPSRAWHGNKIVDCKSYSLFIGSVLKSLGIESCFRFVSYSSAKIYTHVYVVVPVYGKSYYTLDCCMNEFNKEKKPISHYLDKKI